MAREHQSVRCKPNMVVPLGFQFVYAVKKGHPQKKTPIQDFFNEKYKHNVQQGPLKMRNPKSGTGKLKQRLPPYQIPALFGYHVSP